MHDSRRSFLKVSSVLLAVAPALPARAADIPRDDSTAALMRRISLQIQAYDAQGNHRTGSSGDAAAGGWLADEAAKAGAIVDLEPFSLDRVDPVDCHVESGGRRIEGVPLFDATFTSETGLIGRVGPLGSDADIGVTESEPSRLTDPGSEGRRAVLSEVRRSRHKAVLLATRGPRPGLFLLNAPAFVEPFGPPTLQISSVEAAWLARLAASGASARVTVHVRRVAAQASNVVARVEGRDPSLAPIVVTTPRSGWWESAGERGGGIACWLEAIRVLAASKPRRECLFVAFSGHEIAWLGMRDYLRRRPDAVKRAAFWLHFGANVGAPDQPSMVNASDDGAERWAASAMASAGLRVDRRAARGSTPFGEAAFVHRGGGRYVSVVCDSAVFHNPADRWPEAVDVRVVAQFASGFANALVDLADGA